MTECTELLNLLQLIDHHITTIFIVTLFLLGAQIGTIVVLANK